jgi:hypothetical protein
MNSLEVSESLSMNLYNVNGRLIKQVLKQKLFPKGYSVQKLDFFPKISIGF